MELENLDSGSQGFRALSQLRVVLGMAGVSLSLVFFLIVMTLKGNFSVLWLFVTLACGAGTILAAMGWRERKAWFTAVGAASLVSLVVVGLAVAR